MKIIGNISCQFIPFTSLYATVKYWLNCFSKSTLVRLRTMIKKYIEYIFSFLREENYKKILLLAILVGLGLRLLLSLTEYIDNDGVGYIMMANYLYNGKIADAIEMRPMYPMLYPLLLSFGKLVGLNIEKFGIFLSIITSTAAIYLVWLVSRKITNNIIISLIAVSFMAVHPQFIDSSVEVLRDSPGLFFGLLAFYLILTAIEKPSYLCWLLAGVILSIACLLRLEYLAILVLVPCWAFFSFIFCKGERKIIFSRHIPGFLVLLLLFFLVFVFFQSFFIEYGSSFYIQNTSNLLFNFLGVKI